MVTKQLRFQRLHERPGQLPPAHAGGVARYAHRHLRRARRPGHVGVAVPRRGRDGGPGAVDRSVQLGAGPGAHRRLGRKFPRRLHGQLVVQLPQLPSRDCRHPRGRVHRLRVRRLRAGLGGDQLRRPGRREHRGLTYGAVAGPGRRRYRPVHRLERGYHSESKVTSNFQQNSDTVDDDPAGALDSFNDNSSAVFTGQFDPAHPPSVLQATLTQKDVQLEGVDGT